MIYEGRCWKLGDDIPIDGVLLELKYVSMRLTDPHELSKYVLESVKPNFAKECKPGDILVAGKRFGQGNAHIQAFRGLSALGVGIVAEWMTRGAFRNCVIAGVPFMPKCPQVSELCSEGDRIRVNFKTGLFENLTRNISKAYQQIPGILLEMVESGGSREITMNILVSGAGTIGSIVGGYLSGSGYNVTLADGWSTNVKVLNQEGLKISGTRGEHHFIVKAIELQELRKLTGSFDIIFISVKTYDTESIADMIRPFVSDDTVVISTQNGISEEFLAARFGSNHVIGAVTEMSGYMLGPGNVVETRKNGGFVIGELDGQQTQRIREIASLMSPCGEIKITQNIMGILWSKLIWNSMMNPLTAISGLGTGSIIKNDRYRKLALKIGMEGFMVSRKHNIKLEPLSLIGVDPRKLDPNSPKEVLAEEERIKMLPEPLNKLPSMAQDIKNKRKTEIDYINGAVVEFGKKLGVCTPVNEEIIKVIHEIEQQPETQSPLKLDTIFDKYM